MNRIIFSLFFLCVGSFAAAQDLSELYERSVHSVVLINTEESQLINAGGHLQKTKAAGIGSGVLIAEQSVLTAAHVVQTAEEIMVTFKNGEKVPGKVETSWVEADLALIKLAWTPKDPVIAKLGDSNSIRIGEPIYVIGAPYGLEYSLSSGLISGRIKKGNMSHNFEHYEFFQTDASINKGNSGGPMFNMKGEVIGVVSYILSNSGGFEGLGFAATSDMAADLIFQKPKFWSGVEWYYLSGTLAQIFNLPQPAGLLVQKVVPLSPAGIAGVKPGLYEAVIEGHTFKVGGDIILEFMGVKFGYEDSRDEINRKLAELKTGDEFTIKVLRGGKTEVLTAVHP